MTACTNNGGSRARRAVTAALVGVLSVGAAPMVALATGAADTGVQLMATTSQEAFSKGVVTAQDGMGGDVTFPEKDLVSFTDESGKYLLPTSINVAGTDYALNLLSGTGNAKVEYFDSTNALVAQVGKGITTNLAKNYDWKAGVYTVKITYLDSSSQYNNCTREVQFEVVEAKLEDAVVFNATDGNKDTSVTGFTYNGTAQKVGLAVDGAALTEGTDYKLTIYKADDATHTAVTVNNEVTGAGTYVAYVDTVAGERVKQITFKVDQLDLTKATLVLGDVREGTTPSLSNLTVNGKVLGVSDITLNPLADTTSVAGPYSASVSAVPGQANVIGSATVSFDIIANDGRLVTANNVTYDGLDFSHDLELNLSEGDYFDAEKIQVGAGTPVDSRYYDISYTNVAGESVTEADLDTPGTYFVTVDINAKRADYKIGGEKPFVLKVVVTGGEIEGKNVTFKYNGEVTDQLTVDYDGTDFLKGITSTVTVGKKTLVQGTDYELVALDESGKKVDSIVNANSVSGSYTVKIESDTYDVVDAQCQMAVKVRPINISGYVYAKSGLMKDFGGRVVIPYTGEDIDPQFTFGYYTDAQGNVCTESDDATWHELPEGSVAVDGIKYLEGYNADGSGADTVNDYCDFTKPDAKVVDSLNAVGYYQLYATLDPEVAVNYTFGADGSPVTNVVEVTKDKVFTDVPSGSYYAEAIYQANAEGYIYGIGGTTLFAPDSSISREDLACVLFRMAGGSVDIDEGEYNEWVSYLTDFSDVDTHAYYAEAVAWTTKMGITKGYGDTFGTGRAVTTEEFVTMLARYAAIAGTDTSVEDVDATLAATPDGEKVSGYAREAMAWAVENEYVGKDGNSLDPQGSVSRGRTVTIAVRYQPEKASIIGNSNAWN
ncbi:S-layer homology domain-containing protein [Thermophilibacter mediterraneus]|uniref:S-layer homology domain-containing protein n=1 Tax=Thermophilibacter mediterraneus TaxID=1871031 RepID=UPI00320B3D80